MGVVTVVSASSAGVSQGLSASHLSLILCETESPILTSQHSGSGSCSGIGLIIVSLELKLFSSTEKTV